MTPKNFSSARSAPDISDPRNLDVQRELDWLQNHPDSEIRTEDLKKIGLERGKEASLNPDYKDEIDSTEKTINYEYSDLYERTKTKYRVLKHDKTSELDELDSRVFLKTSESATGDDKPDARNRSIADSAKADMSTLTQMHKEELETKKRGKDDAVDDYDRFIDRHGITKRDEKRLENIFLNKKGKLDADKPKRKRSESLWILAGMILLESVMNGLFFTMQDGGLIESVYTALLISILNVVFLGYIITVCWRYLNFKYPKGSEDSKKKVWASFGLAFFCLVALALNLFSAHYRDAVSPDFPVRGAECYRELVEGDGSTPGGFDEAEDIPSAEALCLFLNNHVILHGFMAYVFCLLGIFFIFLSVFKWSDIFQGKPGHKEVFIRKKKAEESWNSAFDSAEEDLNGKHNEADEKLMRVIEKDYKKAWYLYNSIEGRYGEMVSDTDRVKEGCKYAFDIYLGAKCKGWNDDTQEPPASRWEEAWKCDWKDIPARDWNKYEPISDNEYDELIANAVRLRNEELEPHYRKCVALLKSYAGKRKFAMILKKSDFRGNSSQFCLRNSTYLPVLV